jgi:hypothetical protein
MVNKSKPDVEAIVSGLLKDNPQGLTIEELSSRAKLNRTTIRVVISGLIGEKLITQRIIGQAKLNYWNFKKK